MKILMIHHYGGLGGGLTSCLDIVTMLTELNNDVTVAIPNPSEDVKKVFSGVNIKVDCDVPEIPILNYHSASSSGVSAIIKYLLSYNQTREWKNYLENSSYDIVILNSIVQSPLIHIIKKLNMKCLLFIRETIKGNVKTGLNPKIAKSMSNADALVFLTKYDKESWGITNDKKQYIVPDVVDIEKFPYEKKTDTKKQQNITFLYLGGLSYVKGAKDLLLAFQKLIAKKSNVQLIILGETYKQYSKFSFIQKIIHIKHVKYVEDCNKLIETLNSAIENVKVVGLTANPGKWYLQSDVVVFPVKKVHQARPVYEAGYYKKSVIVPDYHNFEDSVIDDYNGCYYKKNSIDSLANAMERITRDNSLRKKLADNNWKMYKNKHTYEYAKNCLKVILDEI